MEENLLEKKGTVGGIKIRTVNYLMITIAVIICALLLWKTADIKRKYDELIVTTENYIQSRAGVVALSRSSDYLTSQSRLFTVTGDIQYSNNYFNEAEVEANRDKAVERVKEYASDPLLTAKLEAALDMSNKLMEKEIYSMRLVAEGHHYDISQYNTAVQNCTLNAEDSALSDDGKIAKAQAMLLNMEYRTEKGRIDDQIEVALEHIINHIYDSQLESKDKLEAAMHFQIILIGLLFLMSAALFVMITFFVIKPLKEYMSCIRDGNKLAKTSAYEFNYLAGTYNAIYDLNEANKDLQYTADHDSLTGILNRGAFEDFAKLTSEAESNIALIFIDIDNFKLVNDNYGHDMGDRVLKKLARILVGKFRAADCIARLGDDEFVVIMMNASEAVKGRIQRTFDDINSEMQVSMDDLPQVTISAGVAFSPNGYNDELYKYADTALYRAKGEGRSRCCFHEDR